ncbi:hypothetical protein [Helicobacter salomonis]|uniref:hypothetical protein n=1 Tax=Helicobacter salomonis TaxID=56878 RepID=UPI000CF0E570|nr:hypothetical protein [Helicobacter salomonis]
MGIPVNIKLLEVVERAILKPAIQELNKLPQFKHLCYQKFKTKGMGNRITHIQFYFQPLTKTSKDRKQAQHDLSTIAQHLHNEKTIKQLQRQIKQSEQNDKTMEVLGLCFSKPEQPDTILTIENIQSAQEGYEFFIKYYKDGKVFKEANATLPNKEALLERIAQWGYQRVDLQIQQAQPYHSKQRKANLQESKGFKTFQNFMTEQTQPLNPNDDVKEYIGRNLYMNTNGVPSHLKVKNISTLENGQIQVEVKDMDKPRKALEPFNFKSMKHFKNWFKKYEA